VFRFEERSLNVHRFEKVIKDKIAAFQLFFEGGGDRNNNEYNSSNDSTNNGNIRGGAI
jgi:hypothetical protein